MGPGIRLDTRRHPPAASVKRTSCLVLKSQGICVCVAVSYLAVHESISGMETRPSAEVFRDFRWICQGTYHDTAPLAILSRTFRRPIGDDRYQPPGRPSFQQVRVPTVGLSTQEEFRGHGSGLLRLEQSTYEQTNIVRRTIMPVLSGRDKAPAV